MADQRMTPEDREITKKIRQAVHNDKSLSTHAHNVKIITQGGKVTLRGPVRPEEEKTNIEAKATAVAGEGNVDSQLDIALRSSDRTKGGTNRNGEANERQEKNLGAWNL